jgi:hypothetical protein
MTDEEVMRAALEIAREIVEGSMTPIAGAARIWVLSSENARACFGELKGFIAVASQWDDWIGARGRFGRPRR